MRIDPRARAQMYQVTSAREMAPEVDAAARLQARTPQPLQNNPALRAYHGESGFEGAGAVQPTRQNPALRAHLGESGFEGAEAARPAKEQRIPGALQPGDLNGLPWPGVPDWLKTLLESVANMGRA